MQNLPTAEVYRREAQYMPWGILLSEIKDFLIKKVPQNGTVLDLLCGPGYLIEEVQKSRPDIKFIGVDLEGEFIDYAKNRCPKINFQKADAFTWISEEKFDVVLCTAGLHHLYYDKQKKFIEKISKLIKDDGLAIVGDPYIDDYSNELERKLAAARLGYEYLFATINSGATNDVIEAAITLIENDVFLVEFKTSVNKTTPYFREYFSSVEEHKTWPREKTQYGDYYFILKK